MRTFIFIAVVLCSNSAIVAQSANVLYGERDLKNEHLAVYIDKEGSLYPNYTISNSSLENSNASLINWYAKNQVDFLAISKLYNCNFSNYSLENCNILNDSIISSLKQSINSKKSECTSVSFLIHGYRKPFVKTNGDRTSTRDYATLEETISKTLKTLYVEVYWDGMYGCCFSTNTRENKELYHLLQEAQKNALPVGQSLRKVLYNLRYDTVNVITHSLGAQVAINALFNTNDCVFQTPTNSRINICLIAPALSEDSFKNYYNRTSYYDFKTKDNYKLTILYNEHDFVLRKKVGWFGPGPYKYVNTTLGCNTKGCTLDFQKHFQNNFTNSSLQLIDGSGVGQCHLIACYCSSESMEEMLVSLKK